MSKINEFKMLISIWCFALFTRTVYLSSIKNSVNEEDTTSKLKNILLRKLDVEEKNSNLGDTNVPNYLLDLFETNSLFENNRILLINNSNTIRSHPMFNENVNHLMNSMNKSGFLINFKVTLPKNEILNAGELRLYLNNTPNRCNRQRITINQIIQQLSTNSNEQLKNQYTTIEDERKLIFRQIDTLEIDSDESRWLQFDVLPAIELWLIQSSTNLGLLIKSHCVNENNFNLEENEFIDNLVFHSTNSDQYDTFKPVLLTYSNFQNLDYEMDSQLDLMNKKKRHVNQEEPLSAVRSRKDWKNSKTKDCSIYSMYVDFKEIGWEDWILAPRGYDAGLCYGDCSLSVIRNGNATNHATMQSLSNGIQPDLVPSPCCVPVEFAPIAMVYREGPKSSVLKVYENMIVKKCGCK